MYETFEHTADLGLRVRAASREDLFVDAARGLFATIVSDPATVRAVDEIAVELPLESDDLLLFDWLSELLYIYESRRLVLAEFHVEFDENGLHGSVRGEPIDPARHPLDHEVKAITYHALRVECVQGEWLAEVIVDI